MSDELLDKRSFLLSLIGAVLRELQLLAPELLKHDILQRLQYIVDISQTLRISGGISGEISGYGLGVQLDREKVRSQPLEMPLTTLEGYFSSLLDFIRTTTIDGKNYEGLIVHVNNFDVVLGDENRNKRTRQFFMEMRDFLQTRFVYFFFLGPRGFFRDVIGVHERVKSIFVSTPLFIDPLSKSEIIDAFDERMGFLKSDVVRDYIKPVEDEVIYQLHDLYDGDIRSIMASVRDILTEWSDKISAPLSVPEARLLLGRARWRKVEDVGLTPGKKKIFLHLITSGRYISQTEIAQALDKQESNVSQYLRPFKEANIIEEKEKVGNRRYWGLTKDYEPLKFLPEAQREVEQAAVRTSEQMSFWQ
ncbi:MAG: winged helix-turn-helix domain-containing protein [Patescibacteria group bacterium]